MSPTLFLDANIPIYAAGGDHPHKRPSAEILRIAAGSPESFVTSVEVFQELIHYYVSGHRWELGQQVFNRFETAMQGRIEPIYPEDTHQAAWTAGRHPGVSARDLLHTAVMARLGTDLIVSADARLDRIPGVRRLDPLRINDWRLEILPDSR